MDQTVETNYLCKQLIEINKKYESNSFADIDFIELFGLHSKSHQTINDLDKIKRKFTAKYYNLALLYHPDKYSGRNDIINIKNCFITAGEIKSGLFLSFITDIYGMLNNMIKEDPENLINIVNGDTEQISNSVGLNNDFHNLKHKFYGGICKEYLKPTNEQIKDFEDELTNIKKKDTKITIDQTDVLVKNEMEKREQLKINKMFTNEQTQDKTKFKKIFNETFDSLKDQNQNQDVKNEVEAANNVICNYVSESGVGAMIGTNTSITDISEAFGPIKIINNHKERKTTLDGLISQRENQDKLFKNPKLNRN